MSIHTHIQAGPTDKRKGRERENFLRLIEGVRGAADHGIQRHRPGVLPYVVLQDRPRLYGVGYHPNHYYSGHPCKLHFPASVKYFN